MDPNTLVRHLLDAMVRLSDVLQRENDLLDSLEIAGIRPLQAEKSALITAYERYARDLARNPSVPRAIEPALLRELTAKSDTMAILMHKNEARLRANKETNQRLLRVIADAVVESGSQNTVYSRQGKNGVIGRPKAMAMAFNEKL